MAATRSLSLLLSSAGLVGGISAGSQRGVACGHSRDGFAGYRVPQPYISLRDEGQ
jgi:hypothetical protein